MPLATPQHTLLPPPSGPLTVRVAHGFDDMMIAVALRATVFMAEQGCPYAEEFDGNDVCATHIIASVSDEPVGTLRIRWFNSFAKIERAAVRKEFRTSRVLHALLEKTAEVISRKGYPASVFHALGGKEPVWHRALQKYGSVISITPDALSFSGHGFTEFKMTMNPHERGFTIESDPILLNRPEGDWDQPGILERTNHGPFEMWHCPCCNGTESSTDKRECMDCGASPVPGGGDDHWIRPSQPSELGQAVTGYLVRPSGFAIEATPERTMRSVATHLGSRTPSLVATGSAAVSGDPAFVLALPPKLTSAAAETLSRIIRRHADEWGPLHVRTTTDTRARESGIDEALEQIADMAPASFREAFQAPCAATHREIEPGMHM